MREEAEEVIAILFLFRSSCSGAYSRKSMLTCCDSILVGRDVKLACQHIYIYKIEAWRGFYGNLGQDFVARKGLEHVHEFGS